MYTPIWSAWLKYVSSTSNTLEKIINKIGQLKDYNKDFSASDLEQEISTLVSTGMLSKNDKS